MTMKIKLQNYDFNYGTASNPIYYSDCIIAKIVVRLPEPKRI